MINSRKDYVGGQPGDVRIDEIVQGMTFASLAITDDKEGTLAKVGKSNPWHIETLKTITGSDEEAHKPLSKILSTHLGLTCDKIIDISGVTPGGHPIDTQGYIAHNDEIIVLAFRCTTSLKDWLTNLNTTSSEWELEEDFAQGYSGLCSGLDGLCCVDGEHKPRVHTGFYNNFLAAMPDIKEHVNPLLESDQPVRKLYVVGHSLGAGIATLASCYFLLEHDWTELPHKLVSVTAGSPRACGEVMKALIEEEIQKLQPLDKAVMCRLVRNKDVVVTVPPSLFGFKHIGTLVFINEGGEVLISPTASTDEPSMDENEMKALLAQSPSSIDTDDDHGTSPYHRMIAKIPMPFRDHMPDFYLKPLIKHRRRECNFV